MPEPVMPPARYETSDVPARRVLLALPCVLGGVVLAVLLVRWLYPGASVDRRLTLPLPVYPAPALQADPAADMRAFLQAEHRRLDSAGWDNEAKQAGHIPIGDAMRRVVRDGIADWPGGTGEAR